jgi:multiple sugar transport system ATP-binding protein
LAQIRIEQVKKSYGSVNVLNGVSFSVEDGEFVVFVGPSGCGKTTLLRTIAGLEKPSGGRIIIGEDEVTMWPPARRGVAMVFQSYALYPHMSVVENIAFGLKVAKLPPAEIDARVKEAASMLQIEHLLDRKPKELSGGQRQRVAIGRSIVRQPRAFLFDEPLSNLDAELRVQMRAELVGLHERLRSTMIYVTHDQIEAMTMADRIVVLNGGRIEQIGAPLELYRQPQNRFVAGFIGSPKMNFVKVPVTDASADGIVVELPGAGRASIPVKGDGIARGDMVDLGVRPEHLLIDQGADGLADVVLPATAQLVEHLGSEVLLHVSLAGQIPLVARRAGDVAIQRGDPISIGFMTDLCYIFDQDGRSLTPLGPRRFPQQNAAASPPRGIAAPVKG